MTKLKWSKKDIDMSTNLIRKYLSDLRLDQWKVISHFVDENIETEDGRIAGAEIRVDITYLRAEIHFYLITLENWKNAGIDQLKSTIKHELCHILTEQLYLYSCQRYISERELNHAREKLTEHISKLMH